jgi:hypothetical protein
MDDLGCALLALFAAAFVGGVLVGRRRRCPALHATRSHAPART